MNFVETQPLLSQADYAKKLRPLMPPEAFSPDFSKLWILLINLAIMICGWTIATYLDQWHWYLLWLYLPFTLLMGNSVIALLFSSHDLMHGSVTKNVRLLQTVSLIGMTLLWMPPTFWKVVHNRIHHSKTNSLEDPDRNYLYEQPKTWGKWIQHRFTPSRDVTLPELTLGMTMAWGIHNFRNLSSVLLFNRKSVDYVPAAFQVSAKERIAIAQELLVMFALHFSIMAYLQFNPVKLLLSYFLPIGIGYAGVMFYIYTNHMVCRMTEINDPLVNSLSLRVPKIFDLLHFNFSYHVEHHIFPGLNSNYYPDVQQLISIHYPERTGYLIEAKEAWRLLLQTPRHYRGENTFTDWSGKISVDCPLSQNSNPRSSSPGSSSLGSKGSAS